MPGGSTARCVRRRHKRRAERGGGAWEQSDARGGGIVRLVAWRAVQERSARRGEPHRRGGTQLWCGAEGVLWVAMDKRMLAAGEDLAELVHARCRHGVSRDVASVEQNESAALGGTIRVGMALKLLHAEEPLFGCTEGPSADVSSGADVRDRRVESEPMKLLQEAYSKLRKRGRCGYSGQGKSALEPWTCAHRARDLPR